MSYYKPSRMRRHAPPAPVSGFNELLSDSLVDLFADDQPAASPERDNREAPPCACGAPVSADELCAGCNARKAPKPEDSSP